jgi:hypothetical protein
MNYGGESIIVLNSKMFGDKLSFVMDVAKDGLTDLLEFIKAVRNGSSDIFNFV